MLDELKAELAEIEAKLDALSVRMRSFRLVHAVLLGGRICLKSDGLQNASALEAEWLEMQQSCDALLTKRSSFLEKMAVAKGLKLPCNV